MADDRDSPGFENPQTSMGNAAQPSRRRFLGAGAAMITAPLLDACGSYQVDVRKPVVQWPLKVTKLPDGASAEGANSSGATYPAPHGAPAPAPAPRQQSQVNCVPEPSQTPISDAVAKAPDKANMRATDLGVTKNDVNLDTLARTLQRENDKYDPNAVSRHPKTKEIIARGLFQFTKDTADQMGISNPFDPKQSVAGAMRYHAVVRQQLRTLLKREPVEYEVDLGYFQGPAGANRLIRNPDAKLKDVLGSGAIEGNKLNPDMTAKEFILKHKAFLDRIDTKKALEVIGSYGVDVSAALAARGGFNGDTFLERFAEIFGEPKTFSQSRQAKVWGIDKAAKWVENLGGTNNGCPPGQVPGR